MSGWPIGAPPRITHSALEWWISGLCALAIVAFILVVAWIERRRR